MRGGKQSYSSYRPQLTLNCVLPSHKRCYNRVEEPPALRTVMQFTLTRFAFCAGFGMLTQCLWAHHAFSAEFDAKQSITFEGVVTRIEWANPHVYFYADVKEKDGRTANWAFETAGPNTLMRLGWGRNSLKVGDHITVLCYPARDGARVASARSVLLENGRKVFAGSPIDGGPQP